MTRELSAGPNGSSNLVQKIEAAPKHCAAVALLSLFGLEQEPMCSDLGSVLVFFT